MPQDRLWILLLQQSKDKTKKIALSKYSYLETVDFTPP